jgi:thioredoxin reductase (NADPH)
VRSPARAIIIATGATDRTLDVPNISRFEGSRVYYGAAFMEAQLCLGEKVVVGGGNSARRVGERSGRLRSERTER